MTTERHGRVETGLDRELKTRNDVGPAERAALRAQARAVDLAEAEHDSHAVTRASEVYLRLRTAAGMTAGTTRVVDSWDAILADITRTGPGHSDPTDARP